MTFHPLEQFGFAGAVVSLLMPVGDSFPSAATWLVIFVSSVACIFVGQFKRHRAQDPTND